MSTTTQAQRRTGPHEAEVPGGGPANEQAAGSDAAVDADPQRWKALGLLCLAFFMVILDSSIVVVVLPSIQRQLGFSADQLQWVLSSYLLAFGGLLLLGGRSADLLGRRRMLIADTALFATASLACGLAPSPAALIGARVVEGLAAALMTPTALSLVMTTFPEGAERNKALAVWAATGSAGATAAWLIGGPVTSALGWEWIFFINVPIGVVTVALSPQLLAPSPAPQRSGGFDAPGAITITLALVSLVYAVVQAPKAGWGDAQTLGLLALSVVLAGVFWVIESRARAPLAPPRVFRSRTLAGGNLLALTLGMLAFGMPFLLTQYAQRVLGFSPLEFGLGSVVMPLGAAVGSAVGQAVVTKAGVRPVALASLVLMGAGLAVLTRVGVHDSYWPHMFLGLLIFGPGLGAGYVSASVAALAGVSDADAGVASGLNNASFQIGGAIGVAVVSTVAVSAARALGSPAALTHGFRSGFAAAIAFAAVGLVMVTSLVGRRR